MKIPFSPPDITSLEIDEVIDTLKSGWITTGPKTKQFEKELAAYIGNPQVVCLNSATSAMELTLRILGIGEGDEVITTAYTYSASASVIHHVGARIVLVDTAKDSFHIGYDQLEKAITCKTKAIIPVDIAGVMCDYNKIFEILDRKKNLFTPTNLLQHSLGRVAVLADAAHSFGALHKNIISGQAADFTCFSFHAVKNLTTAEGGAVTWRQIPGVDDIDLYKKYTFLSLHGQTKDALDKNRLGSWEYDIVTPAYKCNMTDIAASIGIKQLQRYSEIIDRRKRIIESYDALLKDSDVISLKHFGSDFSSGGHLYLTRLEGKDEHFRNNVIIEMAKKGISLNVHYKPLPMFTAYQNLGFEIKNFPNAFDMYKNEITLPLHTLLTDDDIVYVAESLKDILYG